MSRPPARKRAATSASAKSAPKSATQKAAAGGIAGGVGAVPTLAEIAARAVSEVRGRAAGTSLLTGVIERRGAAKRASSSSAPAAEPKVPASLTPLRSVNASPKKAAPSSPRSVGPSPEVAHPPLVSRCLRALDEKKAEDVVVVDVRGKSPVTDFLVIATGTSEPHLRALRVALERELAEMEEVVLGSDGRTESGWCVVDAFDVVFHLFLPAQRSNYRLEQLWARR
ncbi:MAG: ribosome silencing factor [Puniceicoccales bacterium]|jgi:ribosome-associated protein|nr:ribosome silencing factor [Puniceicoccales bacterium]